MAGKCSRNGMKVGMRCCFVVSRPPAKFHRIRGPFDAPTDNYSGSIAGLTSDVFGLWKQMPSPLSSPPRSLATAHLVHSPTPLRVRSRPMRSHGPKTLSAQFIEPLSRARMLSRTRPGESSPLGREHPQTSTKYHNFIYWTL